MTCTYHMWVCDGPMNVSCDECGAEGRIVLETAGCEIHGDDGLIIDGVCYNCTADNTAGEMGDE